MAREIVILNRKKDVLLIFIKILAFTVLALIFVTSSRCSKDPVETIPPETEKTDPLFAWTKQVNDKGEYKLSKPNVLRGSVNAGSSREYKLKIQKGTYDVTTTFRTSSINWFAGDKEFLIIGDNCFSSPSKIEGFNLDKSGVLTVKVNNTGKKATSFKIEFKPALPYMLSRLQEDYASTSYLEYRHDFIEMSPKGFFVSPTGSFDVIREFSCILIFKESTAGESISSHRIKPQSVSFGGVDCTKYSKIRQLRAPNNNMYKLTARIPKGAKPEDYHRKVDFHVILQDEKEHVYPNRWNVMILSLPKVFSVNLQEVLNSSYDKASLNFSEPLAYGLYEAMKKPDTIKYRIYGFTGFAKNVDRSGATNTLYFDLQSPIPTSIVDSNGDSPMIIEFRPTIEDCKAMGLSFRFYKLEFQSEVDYMQLPE